MGRQHLVGLVLNRGSDGAQVLMFRQHHAEHLDGLGVFCHRESDAVSGRSVEVGEEATFIDFATDHRPRLVLKRLW